MGRKPIRENIYQVGTAKPYLLGYITLSLARLAQYSLLSCCCEKQHPHDKEDQSNVLFIFILGAWASRTCLCEDIETSSAGSATLRDTS